MAKKNGYHDKENGYYGKVQCALWEGKRGIMQITLGIIAKNGFYGKQKVVRWQRKMVIVTRSRDSTHLS